MASKPRIRKSANKPQPQAPAKLVPADHKVYVHGPGAFPYQAMFIKEGYTVVPNIADATIICFTGGADVDPALYGDPMLMSGKEPMSYIDQRRDEADAVVYGMGIAMGALMVGICRGGQFLNVMSGGKMWQHVDGHAGGPHSLMDTITGQVVRVSSTHHQMMRPSGDGEILAIAREASYKLGGSETWSIMAQEPGQEGILDDVEAVWYEEGKCLCFQPHPEHPDVDECRQYFFSLLERFAA